MTRFIFLIDCIGSTVEDILEDCEPRVSRGCYRENPGLRQWQGTEGEETVLTDIT